MKLVYDESNMAVCHQTRDVSPDSVGPLFVETQTNVSSILRFDINVEEL
jgi:hypothetical protein